MDNIKQQFATLFITNKTEEPMQYFTQEDMNPSERTLHIIRQIAYTYRPHHYADGQNVNMCLN